MSVDFKTLAMWLQRSTTHAPFQLWGCCATPSWTCMQKHQLKSSMKWNSRILNSILVSKYSSIPHTQFNTYLPLTSVFEVLGLSIGKWYLRWCDLWTLIFVVEKIKLKFIYLKVKCYEGEEERATAKPLKIMCEKERRSTATVTNRKLKSIRPAK